MSARRAREAEVAVIRPAQPRNSVQAVAGATERRLPGALEVPIEQVESDPEQPRQDWDHDSGVRRLEELAASVLEFGILQPLVIREEGALPDGRQRYVVIAGARRRAAAERAGLATVPVIVRGEEATRVRFLQLIENLQRHDLSPLNEAQAYQELMDLENLSPPLIAARLHISAQHVRDRLRVLSDQVLADAVNRDQIAATTARDIMQLPDEEAQAFRARVLSGESVQTRDVQAVRARLAAAGIVNPRRKNVPPKKQTSFVPPDMTQSPREHISHVADNVRPREHVAQQGSLTSPVASQPSTPFENTRRDSANPVDVSAEHLAAILDSCLGGEDRGDVTTALQHRLDALGGPEWWLLVGERLCKRLQQGDERISR
jgi:ParB family chromosome partitioning protein